MPHSLLETKISYCDLMNGDVVIGKAFAYDISTRTATPQRPSQITNYLYQQPGVKPTSVVCLKQLARPGNPDGGRWGSRKTEINKYTIPHYGVRCFRGRCGQNTWRKVVSYCNLIGSGQLVRPKLNLDTAVFRAGNRRRPGKKAAQKEQQVCGVGDVARDTCRRKVFARAAR